MWNKMKDLFIQPDSIKPLVETPKVNQKEELASPPSLGQPKKEAVSSAIDPKISEFLQKTLSDSALNEYDYLKFIEAQKALEAVLPDEATRLRTTFMTVKSTGVTKAKLVETAGHYIAVLNDAEKDFLKTEAIEQEKLAESDKDVKKLEADIAANLEAIRKMQDEIAEKQAQHKDLSSKSSEALDKIERTKEGFSRVCDGMRLRINQDIEKINKFLE